MDNDEEEITLMAYIDMLAPEHERTGCEDPHSYNAAFKIKGVIYNKCNRCSLLMVAELARTEMSGLLQSIATTQRT